MSMIVFSVIIAAALCIGFLYIVYSYKDSKGCARNVLEKKRRKVIENIETYCVNNRGTTMDNKPVYGLPYEKMGV